MLAGGHLRHHPAELGMQRDLTVDGVPEQTDRVVVERDTGLVTGGLDSQYSHPIEAFAFFRPMIYHLAPSMADPRGIGLWILPVSRY